MGATRLRYGHIKTAALASPTGSNRDHLLQVVVSKARNHAKLAHVSCFNALPIQH